MPLRCRFWLLTSPACFTLKLCKYACADDTILSRAHYKGNMEPILEDTLLTLSSPSTMFFPGLDKSGVSMPSSLCRSIIRNSPFNKLVNCLRISSRSRCSRISTWRYMKRERLAFKTLHSQWNRGFSPG